MEEKKILTGTFTSYDVISLESSKLKKDLRQKNKDFKCEIPSDLLSNSTFKVEENEIRTTDFQSVISNGKIRKKEDKKNECDTYQGYINGIEEQWLRLYADDNMIMGMFHFKEKGDVFMEPLFNVTKLPSSKSKYIIYAKSAIMNKNAMCASSLLDKVVKSSIPSKSRIQNPWNICQIVRVAIEADTEWNILYGGYGPAFAAINNANGVYQNGFNLRMVVSFAQIWSDPGSDPYSQSNPFSVLDEFRNFYNSSMSWVGRDIAHLFTARPLDEINNFTFWGLATRNTMCNPWLSYGFTSSASPHIESVTTHELGHNLGATDLGPNCNSVMCQGFSSLFASTFDQQSINEINNHLNNSGSCLDNGDIPEMYVDGNYISPYSQNFLCLYNWYNFYAPGNHNLSWNIQNNGANAYVVYPNGNNAAVISTASNEGYFTVIASKSNACGYIERYYGFYTASCYSYRVYPNPATDLISIEFLEFDNVDDLPDIIELFNEDSNNSVKSAKPKEFFKSNQNGNRIEFDVKNLKRGTYYLHVNDSKRKEKPKEIIRIILL